MEKETSIREYQTRAILFIDLLGFKNAVNESVNRVEVFEKIFKAVNSLYKAKDENYKGPLRGDSIGVEISTFSDSLIISIDLKEKGSFFYLINMAYFAIIEIIESGFVARGAITVGKLYHDKKVVFGPAMNDVYALESKCAIYPRIILLNETVESMLLENRLNEADEERKWYECLLKTDDDGFLFIDFLTPHHQFDGVESYCWILNKTKELIVNGLKTSFDKNIKQKYAWLKTYFNNTLDLLPVNNELFPTKII